MRVILREDLPNLGDAGDVVEVKAGYARNYLIPRKLAMEATEGNLKTYRDIARAREARSEKELAQAQSLEQRLGGTVLTAAVEVGEEEQMYGSVTAQMIVDMLADQGIEVERRQVMLKAPIKELGNFDVPIRLHREVEPSITVVVEKRVEEE
jgi:large subunit ribosomal protein L9